MLREDRLRRALMSGWATVKTYLDGFEIDDQVVQDIAVTLKRTNKLILKRPTSAAERDSLFDELLRYVNERAPAHFDSLKKAVEIIRFCEDGYHGILSLFENTTAATLKTGVRVWLALSDCADTFNSVAEEHERLKLADVEVVTHNGPALDVLGDIAVIADDVNDAMVGSTTSIILMAAISAGWHNASGQIILPVFEPAGEADGDALEEDRVLAGSWAKWRLFEERLRYLGGDLVLLRDDDFDTIQLLQDERLSLAEACIHLAKERLRAKFFSRFQFIKDSGLVDISARRGASLPPKGYLSYREATSLQILSEMFSIAFHDDHNTYGGLRVIEWLRAYSILQALAGESFADRGREGLIQLYERDQIGEALFLAGLSESAADAAISNFTLHRSSVDLFDAPIVTLESGQLMLFGPALIFTSPVQTLASIFKAQRYDFKGKGPLFESAISKVFEKHGVAVGRVCETKEGQTYECEVVANFADLTLTIECKNRAMPGSSPAQMYYFFRQVDEDIEQVKRFASFFEGNRELREAQFGPGHCESPVLPCIASSNLLWFPPADDVFFCDSSMLHRFFEDRYIFVNKAIELDDGIKILHRVAVDNIWEGETPTSTDFLRYLADPPQIKSLVPTIAAINTPFPIGKFVAVAPSFTARNATLADTLGGFSASEETVRDEFDKVERLFKQGAARGFAANNDNDPRPNSTPAAYRVTVYRRNNAEADGKKGVDEHA